MRLLVFFDLPVVAKKDKRAYVAFRRFLLRDGYDMIQFSIYGRIINGPDVLETHIQRLRNHLPGKGHVRCLHVTEKQCTQMRLLVGTPSKQEKIVTAKQMVLL